jgi:hypothetical protein
MISKKALALIAFAAIVVPILIYQASWGELHTWYKTPNASKCVASGDEKCPSQYFLNHYEVWKEQRDKLRANEEKWKPEYDLFKVLGGDLQFEMKGEAGDGYDFSEKKLHYVKSETPAPTTTPAAPAQPAPTPAKPK